MISNALVLAVLFALAVGLAATAPPAPASPVPLPRPRPQLPIPPVDIGDIDRIVGERWPRPIQVVSYRPAAVPVATQPEPVRVTPVVAASPVTGSKPKIKRERKAYAYDICRGKGRHTTRGGKSWRCNR